MQPSPNRPRVFVSSTIRDFRDLRSALKFWLQERGVEVWMSEFPDTVREPDAGTLDACRAALEASDFYVLLVGGRKGWTVEPGLTATRWEYRLALEIARHRPLKIVVFVRNEIKTALAAAPPDVNAIPDAGIDDVAFTADFIREVETTEMPRADTSVPANTLYVTYFGDFQHLAEALTIALRLYQTVRARALLANLKWELEENVAALLKKQGGVPFAQHYAVASLRPLLPLPDVGWQEWQEPIALTRRQAWYLWWFWSTAHLGERLRVEAVREAVLSGEFLIFDREQERLVGTPTHQAMQRLLAAVDDYRDVRGALGGRETARAALEQAVLNGAGPLEIALVDLALLYRLADLTEDIIRLSLAHVDHAARPEAEFRMPTLSPPTPFRGDVGRLLAEQATHEDVEAWARSGGLLIAALEAQPDLKERLIDEMQADIAANPQEVRRLLETGGSDALDAYLQERHFQRRAVEEAVDEDGS